MSTQSIRKLTAPVLSLIAAALLTGCFAAGLPVDSEPSLDDPHTVLVDQDNTTEPITGGIGTPVVQSFIPEKPTSTGADIRAHGTGSLEGSYKISLYKSYDQNTRQLSGLVASGEVLDVPRGTDAQVRWDPVAVEAGQTYFLRIELTAGKLVVGSMSANGYPNGQVLQGGGNLGNAPDIYFKTYYAEYE